MKSIFCLLCCAIIVTGSQIQAHNNQSGNSTPPSLFSTQSLNLYRFLKALSRGKPPKSSSLTNIFRTIFSGLMTKGNSGGRKSGPNQGSSFIDSGPTSYPILSSAAPSTSNPPPEKLVRLCILGICKLIPVPARKVERKCFPTECGRNKYPPSSYTDASDAQPKKSLKKIVGGSRAREHSQPWTVLLTKREGDLLFNCGAVIICKKWVLTCAHCFDKQSMTSSIPDLSPDFYTLYVGRHVGWNRKPGRQVQTFTGSRDIVSVTQHSGYTPGIFLGVNPNDIALIRLRRSIQFNDYARPACLPQAPPMVNETVWAAGWGITEGVGPDSSELKEIRLAIHSDSVCNRLVIGFNVSDRPGYLCAGGKQNQDTCAGDSGGPMVGVKDHGQGTRFYLYGLTSVGSQSCNTRLHDLQPGLYMNVTHFLPWIREMTSNCCDT